MDTKMKRTVLITVPYFSPKVGGLENYALQIAIGLKNNGWKVVIACGDTTSALSSGTLHGLIVYRLPIWKTFSNTPVNFKWFSYLRNIIAQHQPDIIMSHSPVPFMFDMTALACGRLPLIVTYHAATLSKPGSFVLNTATWLYSRIEKLSFRRADSIVAVSSFVKTSRSVSEQKKTVVIPNAISEVNSKKIHSSKGLVFIANLETTHHWKGLDQILEAFAVYLQKYGTPPTLTVIGDGAMKESYIAQSNRLGIAKYVNFVGQKVGTQKNKLIRRSSALIAYPTTANDAFPTVLVEAWGQGTAVIVSDIGPMPSLVEHTQTGLMVAASDPTALAEAIHQLDRQPAKAAAMGERGRILTARSYTWPTQLQATIALMESLI